PTLVVLPIGLYIATFLADLAFFGSHHSAMWVKVSFYGGVAGIVTAVAAGIFGYIDYKSIVPDRAFKTARTHMWSNILAMVLFLISTFLLRAGGGFNANNMGWVTFLELLAVLATGLAGYLGGELVYKDHLAVVEDGRARST